MTHAATITRPVLTLPEAEAAHLRAALARARTILEYGSGGSTVMAAELPGRRIWSVESDRDWARMMQGWFAQNPPAEGSTAEVIWTDIGPTRDWGYPADESGWRRYAHYPLAVWDRPDLVQPDLVLVDGRFRTGCALAAALRSQRPLTVLIDDYRRRRHYHRIEEFLGPPRLMAGRMAEFAVTPMTLPADRLLTIMELMTRP